MTPLALWAAVALVALVATACWAILARETAVYVTSGISFVCYSWLSLTGGDVALIANGSPVWVRNSTSSLQFTALAFAIVSLVVFSLRLFGAYPSPTNAAETSRQATE